MILNTQLIKFDVVRLTATRGFLLALGTIILSTLYLIPTPNASFCILKANGYTGIANDLWVAIIVAMSAVLIITTAVFFLLDGSYTQEFSLPLFDLMRPTAISNEDFLLARTSVYFCISVLLLIALTIAVIVAKAYAILQGQFSLFYFVFIVFYIAIPGLLFFSIIASVLEHFISRRIWRIIFYILLDLFCFDFELLNLNGVLLRITSCLF